MTKQIPKRVSIKYSVDLPEVPERVAIMLTELANSFGGIAKITRTSAADSATDVFECLKGMRDLIVILEKAKIRTQDLSDILLGYIEIVKSLSDVKKEAENNPEKKTTKKKTKAKKKKKDKDAVID
tara:strand:+ start:3332 stop:3709 length:378 start_codon:yes stop_codon:yes gene_type:complete